MSFHVTYLSEKRCLACLILGYLVGGVLLALLALAKGLSLLGDIYHLISAVTRALFLMEPNRSRQFP